MNKLYWEDDKHDYSTFWLNNSYLCPDDENVDEFLSYPSYFNDNHIYFIEILQYA